SRLLQSASGCVASVAGLFSSTSACAVAPKRLANICAAYSASLRKTSSPPSPAKASRYRFGLPGTRGVSWLSALLIIRGCAYITCSGVGPAEGQSSSALALPSVTSLEACGGAEAATAGRDATAGA